MATMVVVWKEAKALCEIVKRVGQDEFELPEPWHVFDYDSREKLDWFTMQRNYSDYKWVKFGFVKWSYLKRFTTLKVEKTKTGQPAFWESGGGLSSGGHVKLVTDSHGGRKKALFVRNSGELACKEHALIPLEVGDHVLLTTTSRGKVSKVFVHKILGFHPDGDGLEADVEMLAYNEFEEWDPVLPDYLKEAFDVSVEKATTYHCKRAMYILVPPPTKF